MTTFKNLFLVALSIVVFASCNNDDDKVVAKSRVQIAFKTSAATLKNATASALELTTLQINIAEIEFDIADEMEDLLPGNDSVFGDIDLDGPFLIDLLSEDVSAGINLAIADVPNATYEEIEFEFDTYKEDESKEIYDNTIYAAGTIDGTPFVIKSAEEVEIELEYENGYVLDGTNSKLFIDLNMDQLKALVAAIDFSGAELTEGTILVDDNNNTEILKKFEDAVEQSFDVEEDGDDNDADEDDN